MTGRNPQAYSRPWLLLLLMSMKWLTWASGHKTHYRMSLYETTKFLKYSRGWPLNGTILKVFRFCNPTLLVGTRMVQGMARFMSALLVAPQHGWLGFRANNRFKKKLIADGKMQLPTICSNLAAEQQKSPRGGSGLIDRLSYQERIH